MLMCLLLPICTEMWVLYTEKAKDIHDDEDEDCSTDSDKYEIEEDYPVGIKYQALASHL